MSSAESQTRRRWIDRLSPLLNFLYAESNFFRLHLTAFIFIPLIFSGIFFASNGRFHIPYIDSLFLCYSAMTDTGLTTANLSTLTVWQQFILFMLMIFGDTTTVSWIMIMAKKRYFRTECEDIVLRTKLPPLSPEEHRQALLNSISRPNGKLSLPVRPPEETTGPPSEHDFNVTQPTPGATLTEHTPDPDNKPDASETHYLTDARTVSSSPRAISIALPHSSTHHSQAQASPISQVLLRQRRVLTFNEAMPFPRRTMTILSNQAQSPMMPTSAKYQGLGGFPGPFHLINNLSKIIAPRLHNKLERKLTVTYTKTLKEDSTPWPKWVGLVIGRNSDFHTDELSDERLEELGGAEYRALRLLSYLIPIYFVGVQLIGFILIAPWLSSTTRYDGAFDNQPRLVRKPWFCLFLVISAYTGTGLTLMDTSMLPFQGAYLLIFTIIFVLLAGNHAQPVFLRFIIWIASKFTTKGSHAGETIWYLLHHPRRCFMYLFPSHQTWFLLAVLVLLSAIEWLAFGVLNIGLEAFQSLPIGPRVVLGLFQGIAVRASGLTIISIGSLAPALQFLYVVLMYIAVYPVAMCIRNTNVYEEQSLGIFEPPEENISLDGLGSRERIGKYFGWHLRHQLSIDIWWLVWGIFFVAIIERENIIDPEKPWFNMFSVIFELVSAFAGVGLSLGFPSDNFSLVGSMHKLSKLVVIVIMVRGRHRGLPVAVDRAILNIADTRTAKSTAEDPTQQTFFRA